MFYKNRPIMQPYLRQSVYVFFSFCQYVTHTPRVVNAYAAESLHCLDNTSCKQHHNFNKPTLLHTYVPVYLL